MPGGGELTPGALQWFQSIWSAATERMTTAGIWSAIRGAAESQAAYLLGTEVGIPETAAEVSVRAQELLSGLTIFDVNQMRASAGQMISAMGKLAAAADEQAIDASMIGIPPNALSGVDTGLPPIYRARVHYSAVDFEGNGFSDWTSLFLQGEPTTKGDLFSRINNQLQSQVANGTGSPPAAAFGGILEVSLEVV